jgi:hypothetical protein
MRASASILALFPALLTVSSAWADEKQVCSDAYQQAQKLREAHKLVTAREQMKVCARAECPGFIAKDCADWLKDVEPRIPSVVLTGKNAAGADVTDVKVSIDGAPLVSKLDGLAVDVDPGAHTFAFEAADGRAEQRVLVPEGTKAQRVAVTFGAGGAPGTVAMVAPDAQAAPASATPSSGGGGAGVFAEPVSSGLSFGARIGYGVSFGSVDNGTGDSVSTTASGQIPFWLDAGYLLNPYLYIGAYFSFGVLSMSGTALQGACGMPTVGCSGNDLRVGVDVQYRLLGKDKLQPWIGLGFLGYEGATANGGGPGGAESISVNGIEWVSPQAGFDYKFLPTLSAGLFLGVTLAEYFGASANVDGTPVASASLNGHALHGFVFFGAKAAFDLHI